jgi:hypothetical protein
MSGENEGLSPQQLNKLKEAFIKNKHLRLKKSLQSADTNLSEKHLITRRPFKKLIYVKSPSSLSSLECYSR